MPNASTKIAEQLMRHGVDLVRIEASLQQDVTKLMVNLRRTLGKRIVEIDPTDPTRRDFRDARLVKLLKFSDEDISIAYNQVKKIVDDELLELTALEQQTVITTMNNAIGVELVTKRLDRNVLRQLAKNSLIKGAPSKDWWKGQKESTVKAFSQQVKEGMLLGENNSQLVQRVRGTRARRFKDGIMETSTRNAKALIRTSVQTVANEARWNMYQENDDLIKGVEWLSTLDTRTSDICKGLDGQKWRLDGTRMSGTTHKFIRPPAHWQCRSTLVPIIKSWEELNANPKLNKVFKKIPDRKKTRASLDGQVPAEMDYEQWLKQRPDEEQHAVLGPNKYRLWKANKLKFSDLIDQNHNPVTVKELLAA